jgi:hypothetical protein
MSIYTIFQAAMECYFRALVALRCLALSIQSVLKEF